MLQLKDSAVDNSSLAAIIQIVANEHGELLYLVIIFEALVLGKVREQPGRCSQVVVTETSNGICFEGSYYADRFAS